MNANTTGTEIPIAPRLVIDVETFDGNPEETARHFRDTWWPDEKWTPETIGDRFKRAIAKNAEQGAVLNHSEIATIQLRTPFETVLLHKFFPEPARWFEGEAWVLGFETEAELLLALRTYEAQRCDDGTLIVGFNINGFDLLKIRTRSLKHGLNVPKLASSEAKVLDLMDVYTKKYSTSRVPYEKLANVLREMGIASNKDKEHGGMFGEMVKAKEFERALRYGLRDVKEEEELYLRMTGQSAALK